MAYRVNLAARAERDLAQLYEQIHAADSHHANNWYYGLRAAILSLRRMPERCPVAPEDSTLRHLLYGRKPHVYRIIFRINKKSRQVDVLHLRHGARRRLRKSDL
ncbi:MAG: type II toxin-antitoxin system RelE/ParE family toxin [Terriglobales bacterium]